MGMPVKTAQAEPQTSLTTAAALGRLVDLIRKHKRELRRLSYKQLEMWIYEHWYIVPDPPPPEPREGDLKAPLAASLRAALESADSWTRGWVVLDIGPGQSCLIGKGNRRRLVRPGEFGNMSRRGAPAVPGDEVAAFKWLTWIDPETGFFIVHPDRSEPTESVVRLYCSVSAANIGHVLPPLVRELDALNISWSLKCPSNPEDFRRVDSLVVYIGTEGWSALECRLPSLAAVICPFLRCSIPPLTRQLEVGMGFAEDPPENQSFGETRCKALTSGAMALSRRERIVTSTAIQHLRASLQVRGIDPELPWRNPVAVSKKKRNLPGTYQHG